MLRSATLVPFLLLVGCATNADFAPILEDTEAYLDQEILLAVHDADGGIAVSQLQEDFGLREIERYDAIGVGRYSLPADLSVRDAVDLLGRQDNVRFVEPNYLVRMSSNDIYRSYQWNLDQIGVDAAWAYGSGAGIVVAVLDTGVRDTGPDGLGTVLAGYDFYNDDNDPTDGNGHGTFVAGTIAQATNNNKGVAGIAYGASILPVKVLSDNGYGDLGAIVNGIVWATNQGAQVINMSLGTTSSTNTMKEACEYAYNNGVVLVAASGNEYASSLNYPGAYDTVIAVGANRYDGTRSAYSNYGNGLDITAPGGDVSRDQNGDGYIDGILQETFERGSWTYTFWEGTSMASPHVAATAALVMAQGVTDPADVYDILTTTAVDMGDTGYDTRYGYGRLNAQAAVEYAATGSWGGDTGTDPDPVDEDDDDGGSTGGADTTAPTISSPSAYVQGTRFTIEWVTDEPADTYVVFEGYGTYGDAALTTAHSLSLRGSYNTTYTITLQSTDASGNTAQDGPYSLSL